MKIIISTYTRYADDISFSFTCRKNRLPEKILILRDNEGKPGKALTNIIEENGFRINYDKVRLCSMFSRMEVTGLTVNEFPNVRRKYIKQLSAMLHAWKKYGLAEAENEYYRKYNKKFRASDTPKRFLHVVKGKISFLRQVKGKRDPIFIKYAERFNDLVEEKYRLKIFRVSDPEKIAIDSLWVIESCYDTEDGNVEASQGTGFQLSEVGIVTCAHVVTTDDGDILKEIEVHKCTDVGNTYKLKVDRICKHRDVAICSIKREKGQLPPSKYIKRSNSLLKIKDDVTLLGFPSYDKGNSHLLIETQVASIYPDRATKKFEIADQIREGNSGGPIINSEFKVVGLALEGATKHAGKNGCLDISEIDAVLLKDDYKI